MKKIIAFALPLLVLSLIAIQTNAVMRPVEVERIKDVCLIRMLGDYRTESVLFHYVNLSPNSQYVYVNGMWDGGVMWATVGVDVFPGDSLDYAFEGIHGATLEFQVVVDSEVVLDGAVFIP